MDYIIICIHDFDMSYLQELEVHYDNEDSLNCGFPDSFGYTLTKDASLAKVFPKTGAMWLDNIELLSTIKVLNMLSEAFPADGTFHILKKV